VILSLSVYFSRSIPGHDKSPVATPPHDFLNGVNLEAKSVIVWDIKNQTVIYEKNADEKLPLASIAKVMMALTAIELFPDNTVVNIDRRFLEEEGDTGLFANEKWRLKDLVDFALVVSSNDAAAAIASLPSLQQVDNHNLDLGRAEFIFKMNEGAKRIGLEQTSFYSENGLDTNGEVSGAYGSARDVAKLFEFVLRNNPEILEATKYSQVELLSLNNISHRLHNTNQISGSIPSLLASKTGFTDLSGGNLAIVFDPAIGRPVVIVVLGSTYDGRFTDVSELSNRILGLLSSQE
jgi:D-alanyl-D-alanine carboxypeptidase